MSDLLLASFALQWLVIAVLGVLMLGNMEVQAQIMHRLWPDLGALVPDFGLDIGQAAPPLAGADARTGQGVDLGRLRGQRVVVVFLSGHCGACVDLAPHLSRIAELRRDVEYIAVIMGAGGFDYGRELSGHIALLRDEDRAMAEAYHVDRAPLVYVVDGEGVIAMRSVSNRLVDLEDTIDGAGRGQGSARWVATE